MAFPRLASEPLADHPRYTKLKDLNKGSYGFVQLAHDKIANEDVRSSLRTRWGTNVVNGCGCHW